MAQWHIAAQNPPHLTCFAPLEGCSDFYRESLCRGGVPYLPFWGFLGGQTLFGKLHILRANHRQSSLNLAQEETTRKTSLACWKSIPE